MKYERRHTRQGADAFEGIKFVSWSSRLTGPDGRLLFEARDIYAPDFWSQVAVDILAQKYLRKAGVPAATRPVEEEGVPLWLQNSEPDWDVLNKLPSESRMGGERDARQVFRSLAGCWTYWGWKHSYFLDVEAVSQRPEGKTAKIFGGVVSSWILEQAARCLHEGTQSGSCVVESGLDKQDVLCRKLGERNTAVVVRVRGLYGQAVLAR